MDIRLVTKRLVVKTQEAVEKVGVVPINDLESSSEQPKIGMSGVRSGIRYRFEGVFQQAGKFGACANRRVAYVTRRCKKAVQSL